MNERITIYNSNNEPYEATVTGTFVNGLLEATTDENIAILVSMDIAGCRYIELKNEVR